MKIGALDIASSVRLSHLLFVLLLLLIGGIVAAIVLPLVLIKHPVVTPTPAFASSYRANCVSLFLWGWFSVDSRVSLQNTGSGQETCAS